MRKTLLLSAIYEPISFIEERKVISLLIRDVVEIQSSWEDEVLLTRFGEDNRRLLKPAVLRLTHGNARPARIPSFRRSVVFARDEWRCQFCGRHCSVREASIDHVKPQSRGGATTWRNCVTACKTCNRKKDDRTPEEAGMPLRSVPTAPTLAHLWGSKNFGTNWHPEWDFFIPQ